MTNTNTNTKRNEARALLLSAMLNNENAMAQQFNEMLEANMAGIGDNKAPAFADVFAAADACNDYIKAIELSTTLGKTAELSSEVSKQSQLRYWIGTAIALTRINFDVKDSTKCETVIKARWPNITEAVLKNRVSVLRAFCNGERHKVLRDIVTQVHAKYAGGESMENTVYSMLVRAKAEGKAKGKKDGEMVALDTATMEDVITGKSREAKREAAKEAGAAKAKAALEQVSVNQLAMEAATRVYTKVEEEADISEAVKAFEKALKAAWSSEHAPATAKALRAAKK